MQKIEQIGKYKIIEIIGKGGMGKVYKARDTLIKRHVAIKMMSESGMDKKDTTRQRFFREAQAIGQLQHPNIITLFDAGEYEKIPYLVMEYLEGKDLGTLIKLKQTPGSKELLKALIDVCEALAFSHQRGVVHRDIKPGNIFILDNGDVKLMDFGIAKMDEAGLTQTGTLLGTIHYMSPEQIKGKDVDYRTDIFSLGVVMYEVFSGRRPFTGSSFSAIISTVLFKEPEAIDPTDKDLPEVLEAIIKKAMAKNRENRYQEASELALDLTKVLALLEQKKAVINPFADEQQASTRTIEEPTATATAKKAVPRERTTPAPKMKKPDPKPVEKPAEILKPESQGSHKVKFAAIGIIVLLAVIGGGYWAYHYTGLSEFMTRPRASDKAQETPAVSEAQVASEATPEHPVVNVDLSSSTTPESPISRTTPVPRPTRKTAGPAPEDKAAAQKAEFENYMARARQFQTSKTWSESARFAQKALDIDPNNAEARALLYQAREIMEEKNKRTGEIEQLYTEASNAYKAKAYDTVIAKCDSILAMEASHKQARELKNKAKKAKSGMSTSKPGIRVTPQPDYLSLGLSLYKQEKYEEALTEFNRLLAIEPKNEEALSYKREIETILRNETRKADINILKLQGQHAYSKGDYEKCLHLMDKLLEVDPENVFAKDLRNKAMGKLHGLKPTLNTEGKIIALREAFANENYDLSTQLVNEILVADAANSEALEYQRRLAERELKQTADDARKREYNEIQLILSQGDIETALRRAEDLKNAYPDDAEIAELYQLIREGYDQSMVPTPTPLPEITIKHKPPKKVLSKEKLTIRMTFFGYDEEVNVYFIYRSTQSRNWDKEKMKEKGVLYQTTIPARHVKPPGMEYFFLIKTKKNVIIYNGENETIKIKVYKPTQSSIPVF